MKADAQGPRETVETTSRVFFRMGSDRSYGPSREKGTYCTNNHCKVGGTLSPAFSVMAAACEDIST